MSTRQFTIDQIDAIERLLSKVEGVIEVISGASSCERELSDNAIPHACWAAEGLLEEIREILIQKVIESDAAAG